MNLLYIYWLLNAGVWTTEATEFAQRIRDHWIIFLWNGSSQVGVHTLWFKFGERSSVSKFFRFDLHILYIFFQDSETFEFEHFIFYYIRLNVLANLRFSIQSCWISMCSKSVIRSVNNSLTMVTKFLCRFSI